MVRVGIGVGVRRIASGVFSLLVHALALASVLALAFVLYFIVREALPMFSQVGFTDFLFGQRWMPLSYAGEPSFGIFNFIAGTLYVSFVALAIAAFVGIGAALFLSCVATARVRSLLYPFIDLLAGIPSVVYGFIGIVVVNRMFMAAGVHTGSCVLGAGIVLAVMLLPYLTSSCAETLVKVSRRYLGAATALGIDRWHAIATIVLPVSARSFLMSMALAIGRAMGETMAVMMVIGSANLFPTLLGKGETIAGLIALEMGTAQVGSTHYHALFAAALVLIVLLLLINVGINLLRGRLERRGEI